MGWTGRALTGVRQHRHSVSNRKSPDDVLLVSINFDGMKSREIGRLQGQHDSEGANLQGKPTSKESQLQRKANFKGNRTFYCGKVLGRCEAGSDAGRDGRNGQRLDGNG